MMKAETFFTDDEKERIQQAVVAAESKTAGEIVPMIVTSAARYTEIELLGVIFGLLIGMIAEAIWSDPWGSPYFQLWPVIGALVGFLISRFPADETNAHSQEPHRRSGSHSRARVVYRSGPAPHPRTTRES
jgi:uncharacterized membrane protein